MRLLFVTLPIMLFIVVRGYGALVYKGQVKDSVNGVDGLWGVQCVTVSPDGRHVYAAGSWDDAISWFSRDSLTGCLTYGGLLKDGIVGADGLRRIRAIAISSDGNYVYATATCDPGDSSVAWFNRNVITGALSFCGLLKNGYNGVAGLNAAYSIALSSDNKNCYTTGAFDNTVVWFNRSSSNGSLLFGAFLKDSINGVDGLRGAYSVCVSNDDKNVYVAAVTDNSVSWFKRDASTGGLSYGGTLKSGTVGILGMVGPASVTASPDGKNVYVAGATSDALVWFTRDLSSGQLTYGGLFQDSVGTIGGGNDTFGMNGAYSVSVSPDGHAIYVASRWSSAVTWFIRDTVTGTPAFGGTIKNISGLKDAKWVSVSPNGAQVYVAATADNAVSWFDVVPSTAIVVAHNQKKHSDFRILIKGSGVQKRSCTIVYALKPGVENRVSLFIATLQGQIIRNLFEGIEEAGMQSHAWNFRTNNGHLVSRGVYLCILSVGHDMQAARTIISGE